MPNGDTQDQKESTFAHKAVVERLRARRDMIATLPIEKQLDVYGVAFDRFAAPMYSKLGLKDKDLQQAKDRWIVGVVSPEKQKPFSGDFGVEQPKHGLATEASAELVGVGAGAMGSLKNLLDFVNRGKSTVGRELLAKGEEKGYKLAHEADPSAAEFGAGVGHAIPALATFETGAGAIPGVAKNAPLAWRALSYLTKTAAGTAAMSTTQEKPTAKSVVTQTGVNIAFDMLLRGLGKAGAKGAARILSKVAERGTPSQKVAASSVDDLLSTVLKEKHPGKTLDQLNAQEFDAATKEAQLRRSTIEQKAKEAKKAVSEAKKAVKPTVEQQVLDKARLAEAKKAETKARNEAARAFHKRLVDYKKVTGSLPTEGHPHLELLKAGKTVSDLIQPPPAAQAVKSAVSVANAHQEAVIREGAPQALAAVDAIKSVVPEVEMGARGIEKGEFLSPDLLDSSAWSIYGKERFTDLTKEQQKVLVENISKRTIGRSVAKRRTFPGTSPTGTERRSITQMLAPVDETIRLKEYYKSVINDPKATEAERAYAADAHAKISPESIGGGGKELAEGIRAARAKSSATVGKKEMFKLDIDKILAAESPQDFAKAKKEAMEDVVRQARELAKSSPESDKMKIVSETNKARERIRSLEVPKTFDKKTLDAVRKQEEAKGTAGSVVVESVESGKSTVTSSADPEVEMLRQEQLTDQLKEVGSSGAVGQVLKAIKGKDIKLQNDMIEAAIEALKKAKKQ